MRLQAPVFWESTGPIALLLWPISLVFGWVIQIRKYLFDFGLLKANALPVPIIFVGNLRVGGTGKTPTVIALAQALHAKGFSPGVISRGYRSGLQAHESKAVLVSDGANVVGDEPSLLANYLNPLKIPVWIGADRYQTGMKLLQANPSCNVIISDDGLSHLKLARFCARDGGRDIEIIVRDARGEGNQFLLPAGPLREPASRERDITLDVVMDVNPQTNKGLVVNETHHYHIPCMMGDAYQLTHPTSIRPLVDFQNQTVLAVAGIANPEKFYAPLRSVGIHPQTLALGDHADYSSMSFDQYLSDPHGVILMTEKDAVKCHHLHDPRIWVIPLIMPLPQSLLDWITLILHRQPENT